MNEFWGDLFFWFTGDNIFILAVQVRGMTILCHSLPYQDINVVHEGSTAITELPPNVATSGTLKIKFQLIDLDGTLHVVHSTA